MLGYTVLKHDLKLNTSITAFGKESMSILVCMGVRIHTNTVTFISIFYLGKSYGGIHNDSL